MRKQARLFLRVDNNSGRLSSFSPFRDYFVVIRVSSVPSSDYPQPRWIVIHPSQVELIPGPEDGNMGFICPVPRLSE